jgi:hypothetical protein
MLVDFVVGYPVMILPLLMFLATQNKIRDMLKEILQATPGYEELLADVINICVSMYESRLYLEPPQKLHIISDYEHSALVL